MCRPIILHHGSTMPICPLSQGRPTLSLTSPLDLVMSSPARSRDLVNSCVLIAPRLKHHYIISVSWCWAHFL